MAQRVPIQLHVANALQWLGTLYRNPADALKEHVSNAIDEHLKAQVTGTALDRCNVVFTLDKRTITASLTTGTDPSPRGQRIRYEEVPFELESLAHSRFVEGVVQANTLHPDHIAATRGTESRLAYAALMIGKESIAFNDRSGSAGDFLEKLLDFVFKLQARSRTRGRKRDATIADAKPASLLASRRGLEALSTGSGWEHVLGQC